jgi:hypothetical protein
MQHRHPLCSKFFGLQNPNDVVRKTQAERNLSLNSQIQLPVKLSKITGSKPSGHFIYRQFNPHKFFVLPTRSIYVFCVDLRTNSDYFPIQH